MVDARVKNPKLKGLVSSLWGYYGLPPSKLSAFYYALPTIGYLSSGGSTQSGVAEDRRHFGRSFITERAATVRLVDAGGQGAHGEGAAEGVRTEDGKEYRGQGRDR